MLFDRCLRSKSNTLKRRFPKSETLSFATPPERMRQTSDFEKENLENHHSSLGSRRAIKEISLESMAEKTW